MKDRFRSVRKDYRIRLRGRPPGKGRNILLLGLALILFAIGGMLPLIIGAASAQGRKPEIDPQRLAGRWVRSDGGYILELRNIHKDGGMEAFYFNPRPIKVSEAVWARQDGKVTVMVELRDVNYPGSTYNLQYDPGSDRLKGIYFQAVQRQTYDIQFVRSK